MPVTKSTTPPRKIRLLGALDIPDIVTPLKDGEQPQTARNYPGTILVVGVDVTADFADAAVADRNAEEFTDTSPAPAADAPAAPAPSGDGAAGGTGGTGATGATGVSAASQSSGQ